jgi:hypothetical protein
MKKSLLACLTAAALVLAFALPSIYAEEVPEDGLVLDYTDDPKGYTTTFNHSTHADVECTVCHHVEGEQQYASCAADGCHDAADKKAELSWYKIAHDRKAGDRPTCMSRSPATTRSSRRSSPAAWGPPAIPNRRHLERTAFQAGLPCGRPAFSVEGRSDPVPPILNGT